MPKPPPRSEPPPSSRPAATSPRVLLVHRILKLAAFVVGLPAALLCGMALVGAFTDNGYARVLVAAVVVVGLPLVVADRLLPADHAPAPGLVSDVCAVTWMVITFGFAAALGSVTRPLLAREGDRLVASGHGDIAQGAYLLAGLRVEVTPAVEAAPSGEASGSAAPVAADAGAAAPAVAGDAGGAGDGGGGAGRRRAEKAADKTPAELFKEASPAVVTLSAFRSDAAGGGGTGFLIDREGTIATNHHVIQGAVRVRVKLQSGAAFDEVELLVDDASVDLALLRVDLAAPADGSRVEVKAARAGQLRGGRRWGARGRHR